MKNNLMVNYLNTSLWSHWCIFGYSEIYVIIKLAAYRPHNYWPTRP